jgi:hypothetical protein
MSPGKYAPAIWPTCNEPFAYGQATQTSTFCAKNPPDNALELEEKAANTGRARGEDR